MPIVKKARWMYTKTVLPLAKPDITWSEHTLSVVRSIRLLTDTLPEHLQRFLGLTPEEFERVRRIAILSAFLHDLGKLGSHFQLMMRNNQDYIKFPQFIRHEFVSVVIANEPSFKTWIEGALSHPNDWDLIMCCVLGHHMKHLPVTPKINTEPLLKVNLDHADVQTVFQIMSQEFGLGDPPKFYKEYVTSNRLPFHNLLKHFSDRISSTLKLKTDSLTSREIHICQTAKMLLINADVCGSIAGKPDSDLFERLMNRITDVPDSDFYRRLVKKKLNGLPLRDFQRQAAKCHADVTVCLAGTGSGKSVFAYLWAMHRAKGLRLFFCLPTQGTATEIFKDYLKTYYNDEVTDLSHMNAWKDKESIEGLMENPFWSDANFVLDEEETESLTGLTPEERVARIREIRKEREQDANASLGLWLRQIIACTADAVLGLVNFQRKPVYSFAALAQSGFVFDEVHAYPERLWKCFLKFINTFNAPVLIMTASLPKHRLEELQHVLGETKKTLEIVEGPKDHEVMLRYHRKSTWLDIDAHMRDGLKTLYIVNTVDRAINLYHHFKERYGSTVHCLHSHFRAGDRRKRQDDFINLFKNSNEPVLAITTQVAEMSLDISADVLVSELSPVSSVIQRLGRLNRYGKQSGLFWVVLPKSFTVVEWGMEENIRKFLDNVHLPYSKNELMKSYQWLMLLNGRVSQRDLIQNWRDLDQETASPDYKHHQWTNGVMTTRPEQIRDDAQSIRVVLDDGDWNNLSYRDTKSRADLLSFPINYPPREFKHHTWARLGKTGIYLVEDQFLSYSQESGGQWKL